MDDTVQKFMIDVSGKLGRLDEGMENIEKKLDGVIVTNTAAQLVLNRHDTQLAIQHKMLEETYKLNSKLNGQYVKADRDITMLKQDYEERKEAKGFWRQGGRGMAYDAIRAAAFLAAMGIVLNIHVIWDSITHFITNYQP